ncbi:hypothetical protein phiAS5_ORF0071 [Aeromonas phage phiAS5]|uniref:Uncharacterized protein n=1 Tax=Aeromonas phage phiAS5 TaxID=879630 RepID=E1A2G8_9CAUD|nr:hypothetical protein phiAS5_ORF0071 [Aeromonas phage phiAS5]ADM79914.1 hypothetical protein phiAS5_ORF0071 [Aeromonas phage phiAS5]BES53316.1 hypothetical protein [Aeromonas phage phiWae14]
MQEQLLNDMNLILSKVNIWPANGAGGYKGYQTFIKSSKKPVFIPFVWARRWVEDLRYNSTFHPRMVHSLYTPKKCLVVFTKEQVEEALKQYDKCKNKNFSWMFYRKTEHEMVYQTAHSVVTLKVKPNTGLMGILQEMVDGAWADFKADRPVMAEMFTSDAIAHKYSDDFFARRQHDMGRWVRNWIIDECRKKRIQLDFKKNYWLDDVWIELVRNSIKGK